MVRLIALNDTYLDDRRQSCVTIACNPRYSRLYGGHRTNINKDTEPKGHLDKVGIKAQTSRVVVREIVARWIYIGSRLNFSGQFTSTGLSIGSRRP